MSASTPIVIRKESQGPIVSGIAIGFVATSAVAVALRFYTRTVILKITGKDDWTLLGGLLCSIVVSVATCFEVKYGMGRHFEAVSPAEGLQQLKFLLISIIHYNLGMNIVKISFLFQYRRIFQSKTIQRVCLCAMIFVILWACLQSTLLGLSCLPISYIVPSTSSFCLNTLPVWYFSSALSLASDCLIFCIPMSSVIKLQLPRKQKFMVFGIFCLGFFVCIISVYRMFTLRTAVYSADPSWENTGAAIWSAVELNTAIICSCLPTLRPLLAKFFSGFGLLSSRNNRSGYEYYGSASRGNRSGNRGPVKSKPTPQTISTEELALKSIETPPSAHTPTVFSHVSADVKQNQWPQEHDDYNRNIMVTTETSRREKY